jgi:hypothetical protein
MPHTESSLTHSPEVTRILKRLAALHTERSEVLEQLRRGSLAERKDALLFELCGFRGLSYTEAADIVGITREGIGRRMRPLMAEYGLGGMSLAERCVADVPRPYRTRKVDSLLDQLRESSSREATQAANRLLAEDARRLREEMLDLISHPSIGHLTLRVVADAIGISVPTLQRVRGKM